MRLRIELQRLEREARRSRSPWNVADGLQDTCLGEAIRLERAFVNDAASNGIRERGSGQREVGP
jgi:hypothetical protein